MNEKESLLASVHYPEDIFINDYGVVFWIHKDDLYETYKPLPYTTDFNVLYMVELKVGLHDKNNSNLRVKWVNHLRKIVSKDCPLNKVGTPIVSDIDLLVATAQQRADALLKALNLWKPEW